ncbi:MAG TPA: hypothetical protein VMT58_08275, partial [Candidatus Binataceae bacterium]|nr:hypothetical protein [Candidatus Binataceae bacterium]
MTGATARPRKERKRIASKPPAKVVGTRTRGGISPHAALAGLLVLAAIVFCRSLGNGFVFDDVDQILNNRYLGEWSFIWKSMVNNALWFRDPGSPPALSYYRPFQNVWFALNFHLFGLNAAGWHAAQVGVHLIVIWLVFRVASILTGDRWKGLMAAGLFALMPIRAEAVVCVFAIGTPLSAAFELAAFDFYLRAGASERRRMISLLLFGLALLSHDCAIVFPALVAAHALLLGKSGTERPLLQKSSAIAGVKGAVAAAWPYAIEAAVYLIVRVWVLGFLSRPNPSNPPMSALDIALTIPAALAAYLKLLAMPWTAGPAHRLVLVDSAASLGFYLPLLLLIAILGAGIFLLREHPHRRLYLFCVAWFMIALAPLLDLDALFFPVAIQDRYLYVAAFGFCLLAADLAVDFARGAPARANAVWLGAAAVAIVFAGLLYHAEGYWQNEVAMFARCVDDDPDAVFCHDRLGMALESFGNHQAARYQVAAAVELAPENGMYRYDLGVVDQALGDRRAAAREMAAGLAMLGSPPAAYYARLAIVADSAGDRATAED